MKAVQGLGFEFSYVAGVGVAGSVQCQFSFVQFRLVETPEMPKEPEFPAVIPPFHDSLFGTDTGLCAFSLVQFSQFSSLETPEMRKERDISLFSVWHRRRPAVQWRPPHMKRQETPPIYTAQEAVVAK